MTEEPDPATTGPLGPGRQVALVTGGARGLGRAIAQALARHGASLALVDRAFAGEPEPPLRDALRLTHDVRDFASAAAAVERTEARLGPLTIGVLNAGISRDAASWKMTEADWREVIDVNLTGAFAWAQACSRAMMTHGGGSLVFVSSINGLRGKFGLANYAASKAGLIGLTRTLARELGPRGIRVNAVAPGFIRTDLTAKIDQRYLDQAVAETALGRLGEPEDVADAVAFLVSRQARHITGTVIPVDGGQIA